METENLKPRNPFLEVGRRDYDSLGTLEWQNYLEAQRLYDAWAPPQGSPYTAFARRGTIDSVDQFARFMWPRYSKGEIKSVGELSNLMQLGILGKETAIILDSGGAHSVAMAATLARDLGYQPVVMLDAVVDPKGVVKAEQSLFVLLYFAREIEKLKLQGMIRPDSPPVFILDCHRLGPYTKWNIDNLYRYEVSDLPGVAVLSSNGITKVVYLDETDLKGQVERIDGDDCGFLSSDLQDVIRNYRRNGLQIFRTGISPWGGILKSIEPTLNIFGGFDPKVNIIADFDNNPASTAIDLGLNNLNLNKKDNKGDRNIKTEIFSKLQALLRRFRYF